MTGAQHIPVMLDEVLQSLQPKDGDVIVDGTFGAGGYTRAILNAANTTVVAFDRDADAIARGAALTGAYGRRLVLIQDVFSNMAARLHENGIESVDGIVLDIGVSSPQIDQPERGFSFRDDGPLDMRMDTRQDTTAADIVNHYAEKDLADIIYRYGEERRSRAIARAIVNARTDSPVLRTRQLADLVARVVPTSKKDAIHPATRTFQALRIAVNDELGELEAALQASLTLLRAGGRLVVVTFHSLEDRIVKQFLVRASDNLPKSSRYLPHENDTGPAACFELITRKALTPGGAETAANPRSRSAKLRAARRTHYLLTEAA